METIVIMTKCSSPYCKSYIMFETRGEQKQVGEVCRRDGKYFIFHNGSGQPLRVIGTRSSEDSAIRLLQNAIKASIAGEVKFRWNVMEYKYKFA